MVLIIGYNRDMKRLRLKKSKENIVLLEEIQHKYLLFETKTVHKRHFL